MSKVHKAHCSETVACTSIVNTDVKPLGLIMNLLSHLIACLYMIQHIM